MNRETLESMVDELIETAKYAGDCASVVASSEGNHRHSMKVMELADRELLELRERLVTTLLGALNGSR